MNNYKKQPFIPAIQKTSTLLALSIIAMVGFIISLNSTKVEVSSSYDIKVKAAMNMQESMNILKSSRMVSGVFIDNDTYSCSPSTDTCPNDPGTDPVRNHMNYSNCRDEFSPGQVDRDRKSVV